MPEAAQQWTPIIDPQFAPTPQTSPFSHNQHPLAHLRGDFYLQKYDNEVYMLAQVNTDDYRLIGLSGGNRWSDCNHTSPPDEAEPDMWQNVTARYRQPRDTW